MADEKHLVSLISPLEDGLLVLRQAKFTESLGNPFEIEIELLSKNENIAMDELLGKKMTLSIETQSNTRFFNGIITAFSQRENLKRNAVYVATLRPWVWLLSLSQHCRIFQQKTYPEIIKSIFSEVGFTDFQDNLSGKYPKQDYVVQFNESDFNFATRIMQQEGIFYTFEHSMSKHTLIMHDDNARLDDVRDVPYVELHDDANYSEDEGIRKWESEHNIKSGSFSLSSFDFELPSKNLSVSTKDPQVKSATSLQRFAYEGRHKQRKDGEHYTKLLMEQENANYTQIRFSGNQRNISCGSKFSLVKHAREDQNAQYLVTTYQCTLRSGNLANEDDGNEKNIYEFTATAMPAKMAFRPEQSIAKQKMSGTQTATVVGKKNEEIWTDKYGRIKVKFHWDELSSGDEESSCWIRVSQSMSGKNWGSIYIPRVGQEVLVDFLEGDPDQPIVVGCIYNGSNMPPYPLPNHSTMSGFRSRSTKNTGTFNEIRFEDKQGEEQIFIHAAKNHDVSVTHDAFETVGKDRHLTINQDQHTKVQNHRFESIGGDKVQKIGKDFNLLVEGKEAKEVRQALSLSVKGNGSEDYEGSLSINADKDTYIKSNNICLEASDNLTIKVGGSFIAIERGGITISSPGNIMVDSKSALTLDAGASVDISSDGPASMKGASVKIN
ncbi:type VI secretion system Vgr family protein [Ningiella sp. W23]|uniref:type VI secretion system Vgr family protein n=1 Tax=Ningiella sp. W23 TaxID=3023715 RepID=UPI003757BCEF